MTILVTAILSLWIGATIGCLTMAILAAGSRADEASEKRQ